MTGALHALARISVRRRFFVLLAWFVVTVVLVVVSHRLGDNTNDNLSLPDRQPAGDDAQQGFPDQANGTSPIVLHAPSGKLTDSKYSGAVNAAASDLAKAPNVAWVVNPLTRRAPRR